MLNRQPHTRQQGLPCTDKCPGPPCKSWSHRTCRCPAWASQGPSASAAAARVLGTGRDSCLWRQTSPPCLQGEMWACGKGSSREHGSPPEGQRCRQNSANPLVQLSSPLAAGEQAVDPNLRAGEARCCTSAPVNGQHHSKVQLMAGQRQRPAAGLNRTCSDVVLTPLHSAAGATSEVVARGLLYALLQAPL